MKLRIKHQINLSRENLEQSFSTILTITFLRVVMSKQTKAEAEKKKKAYYSAKEKKAKEVKK